MFTTNFKTYRLLLLIHVVLWNACDVWGFRIVCSVRMHLVYRQQSDDSYFQLTFSIVTIGLQIHIFVSLSLSFCVCRGWKILGPNLLTRQWIRGNDHWGRLPYIGLKAHIFFNIQNLLIIVREIDTCVRSHLYSSWLLITYRNATFNNTD